MEVQTLVMENEKDTRDYGLQLAKAVKPGEVIALIGDLGTGKTALSKCIAQGLGVAEPIVSPTFTIVNEYHSGRMPLYHFDVYRLNDAEEMYDLGYEEYFFGQGLCIIEWADKIMDLIPEGSRIIRIEYGSTPDSRIYHIEGKA